MGRKFKCGECKKEVSDFSELIQLQGKELVLDDGDRYNDSKFICSSCNEQSILDNADVKKVLENTDVSLQRAELTRKVFTRKEKGEFGEQLVRFLLESTDWYVLPFGYEKSFNSLLEKIDYSKISDESLEKVRYMPDFFCIHQNTYTKNITYFVEVKYRGGNSNEFEIDEVKYYKKYWPGTIIVVVRPEFPYILFQSVDKLEAKDKYSASDFLDGGHPWLYALSPTTISYLLFKFREKHSSDASISEHLAKFKKTPENYFFSYDNDRYYAYSIKSRGNEVVYKKA